MRLRRSSSLAAVPTLLEGHDVTVIDLEREKAIKSIQVGRLQVAAGACGLTVAKAGEAKVMSNASPDILMAYPPVTHARCQQLAELAREANLLVQEVDAATIYRLIRILDDAQLFDRPSGMLFRLGYGYARDLLLEFREVHQGG